MNTTVLNATTILSNFTSLPLSSKVQQRSVTDSFLKPVRHISSLALSVHTLKLSPRCWSDDVSISANFKLALPLLTILDTGIVREGGYSASDAVQ